MIPVTKSFLPPIENYFEQIKKAYSNEWLTNRGKLVLELEERLQEYLGVDNILITNNGTVPIQIALKLLGNNGQIITTPFSYIATTSSILWENCKPVFVDIHPEYLTIDESKIEDSITSKTTCILATHVFGNPCNINAIAKIAKKHKLKVIYDAAHSFGVQYLGKSIFEFGDVSTCSFHATKLFHTGEGGAIFCKNNNLRKKIYYSHNFGHNGPLKFHGLGINGKISELQAAMGLAVFPHINEIINKRKEIVSVYQAMLKFDNLTPLKIRENTIWNYSYFPVIFENEKRLLHIQNKLNSKNIFPRRYFYPSLNTIKFVDGKKMPVSESISKRILCLPLYDSLKQNEQEKVIQIINNESN
jgi:dTDP-4-amino-4,6-dideoxygalactose transaminase